MGTEKQKMIAGEPYLASDPQLVAERLHCRRILRELNGCDPAEDARIRALIASLFGRAGEGSWVEPPFFCDYGFNISIGARFYANFQCVFLDCGPIDIGDDVMLGPNVQLYTATHPIDPAERIKGPESTRQLRIGSRVWIGGGCIVLPGVSIGEGTTLGSGSVVTRDIPAGVLAAGNPCRVLRPATDRP